MGKGQAVLNLMNTVIAPEANPTGPPPKPRAQYEREKAERLEKEANRTTPKGRGSKIKEKLFLPKEQRRNWGGYESEKGKHAATHGHFAPPKMGMIGGGFGGGGGGGGGGGFDDGGGDGGDCGGGGE